MSPKRLSLAALVLLLAAIFPLNPAWRLAATAPSQQLAALPLTQSHKGANPEPVVQSAADGTLVEQSLFRKQYPGAILYEVTYLSDELRVKGFLARPTAAGVYPGVVVNHGGLGSIANPERVALLDYVDASRLGMWGVSHGGQMTLLAIARADQLAAQRARDAAQRSAARQNRQSRDAYFDMLTACRKSAALTMAMP